MRIYLGDTRSRSIISLMRERGWGMVGLRGRLHQRRVDPWFFDNGAFEDHTNGRPFDEAAFVADLASLHRYTPPDFIVAPDIVGGGLGSLARSLEWLPKIRDLSSAPVYLAVQDGMEGNVPARHLTRFDGVFLGGSLDWKRTTAHQWCCLAREHGKPIHFGRCGTGIRVGFARALRVDSLDSSLPLWSKKKLGIFLRALDQEMLISEFDGA